MKTKRRKYRHPDCYAAPIGGCSRELTKEHYISACVLEITDDPKVTSKSVYLRGLSFQKPGEVKTFGIASMASIILCEKHNSALSVYDSHGKAMFQAMQGFTGAALDSTAAQQWHVDGDGFERWLLKSLSGGLYSGAFLIGQDETLKGMVPSRVLLRVLFRGDRFSDTLGLYHIPEKTSEPMTTDDLVMRIEPLRMRNTRMIGGVRVYLFGFQFALLLSRTTPELSPLFQGALYRPAGIANVGNRTRVVFNWAEGSCSPPVFMRAEAHRTCLPDPALYNASASPGDAP